MSIESSSRHGYRLRPRRRTVTGGVLGKPRFRSVKGGAGGREQIFPFFPYIEAGTWRVFLYVSLSARLAEGMQLAHFHSRCLRGTAGKSKKARSR